MTLNSERPWPCLRNLLVVRPHLSKEESERHDHLTSQLTIQVIQRDTWVDSHTKNKQAYTNCPITASGIKIHSSSLSTSASTEIVLVSIII